jgi:flagellum-specific peptidoglycan hydrolase FlgJ
VAAARQYGVPASVTIAQAILESGWGQSSLTTRAHNLFGMKGTGPAGSVTVPTKEYLNGQWVTIQAAFKAYHNDAESIQDHGRLIATGHYYTHAMTLRNDPKAFANALTGVYATAPNYGQSLISIMNRYNLYQFDS